MQLSKFTPANVFTINTPVWGGRKVGLATYKIGTHNEIQILYTNVNGERIYPQPLYISGEKVRAYPPEPLKSNPNIKLHIIPVSELEVLERI